MLIDYAMTGDVHKRHRRIMTPAFGAKESKAFVPLFFAYAAKVLFPPFLPQNINHIFIIRVQLGNKWKDILIASPKEGSVFNVADWFSRATLDAMGVGTIRLFDDAYQN